VAIGIKKELLRRFDPDVVDDPEKKQYYIEKLDSHEFHSKKQEYTYLVKWLGYGPHYDLMLPEPEILHSVVAEYCEYYAQIHGNQSKERLQRRAFAKKYTQKVTDKVITPSENTTWDHNEGLDPSSPPEKLQPGEYHMIHIHFETSLDPSEGPAGTSH
jgi:hypothetical protein